MSTLSIRVPQSRFIASTIVAASVFACAQAQVLEPISVLQPADAVEDNLFGIGDMKIADGRLYVSAPNRPNGGTSGTGAVYVYDAATLSPLATITASNVAPVPEPMFFGRALDVQGDVLLVSSREPDPMNPDREGAAYLLEQSTGAQLSRYTPSEFGNLPSPDFGQSVALAGDIAVVGDPNAAGVNAAIRDGVVTFFDITTGQLDARLRPSVATYDTGFGVAMASKDDVVYIVGESASGVNAYSPDTRLILNTLSPNTGSSFRGADVEIFGDVLVVADSGRFPEEFVSTSVFLFDLSTNNLLRTFTVDPDPGDLGLGRFVAVNDSYLLATRFTNPFTFDMSVLVFDIASGELIHEIQPPTGSGGRFGAAMTLDGDLAYIGTSPSDQFPLPGGAVLVYDLTQIDLCPADVNGDGVVSPADFNAWIAAFNANAPACDQNGNGTCEPADFNAWIVNFNTGC